MTHRASNAGPTKPLIGVAIAVHNSWDVLKVCLEHLFASEVKATLYPVVFDDGSTDGTQERIAEHFPTVRVIRGDGGFWWTGGTNRAVERCLVKGCDHVLLLNPDAFVEPDTIARLLEVSDAHAGAVCAALVVDRDAPDQVIWAGSLWGQLGLGVPVWTSRYIHRRGTDVQHISSQPYETSEVHGRAVLFPTHVMRRCGLHDDLEMPHHGGDTEYSLHLGDCGVKMLVVPEALVTLETRTTGLGAMGPTGATWTFSDARQRYWRQLWDRKSGEQVPAWWTVCKRYVPWYGRLPTFGFAIGLGSFRFWQREMRRAKHRTPDGSHP